MIRLRPDPRLSLLTIAASFFWFLPHAAAAPVVGFVEEWPGTSVQGWQGGRGTEDITNPGTGGVGGAGDGFLRVSQPSNFRLGTVSFSPDYAGDWWASGVRRVQVWLKDVDASQAIEIHFSIGYQTNFWQYNPGFVPVSSEWRQFEVNLADSSQFTQILGTSSFLDAVTNADRIHFRHDLPPFAHSNDNLQGEFGMDRLELLGPLVGVGTPAPYALAAWPNPFSGSVAFTLPVDRGVSRLEVLDVSGRTVRVWNAPLPALLSWDGRDSGGQEAPPGIYLIRARGGEIIATWRLIRLSR